MWIVPSRRPPTPCEIHRWMVLGWGGKAPKDSRYAGIPATSTRASRWMSIAQCPRSVASVFTQVGSAYQRSADSELEGRFWWLATSCLERATGDLAQE